jgi:hypothetical protein
MRSRATGSVKAFTTAALSLAMTSFGGSLRGERRKPNRKMEARQEGARSLYECFHNVDGENLFGALITLAREGIRAKRPISFQ